MTERDDKLRIGMLFGLALTLDQLSKVLIRQMMTLGQSISVLGDILRLTYVENPGIAFGIRIGNSAIFTVLSILASIGVIVYLVTHWDEDFGVKAGLSLILSGAVGNLIDRLLFGHVADFIDMGIGSLRWYVYNIADASVVIGMVVLCYTVYFKPKKGTAVQNDTETIQEDTIREVG